MQENSDICFDEGQDLGGNSVPGRKETLASTQVNMYAGMVRRADHGDREIRKRTEFSRRFHEHIREIFP